MPTEESINIWLVLLAIIFPLFGFIYWPMEYKNRPRTAKACGIAAIISFLVSMAFSFLSFSIFSKFFYDFMDWLLYSNNL